MVLGVGQAGEKEGRALVAWIATETPTARKRRPIAAAVPAPDTAKTDHQTERKTAKVTTVEGPVLERGRTTGAGIPVRAADDGGRAAVETRTQRVFSFYDESTEAGLWGLQLLVAVGMPQLA